MASPNVYGKRKLIENGNEEAEYISPSKRPHLDNPRTFNLLFRNPSKFIIAGPSQAGKTCFALQTLRWIPELFEDARCAQNVVYFYHQDQPAFRRFRKENIVHEWRNHLPTSEEIMQLASPFTKIGGSFVVIDDFGQKITLDTVELFTRISHHSNVVIMLLQQNLFSQINGFRDISLSSTYTVLYKNPRDSSQITALAKQIAPGNTRYVVDIFREATKKPHSYLLFGKRLIFFFITTSESVSYDFLIQRLSPENTGLSKIKIQCSTT